MYSVSSSLLGCDACRAGLRPLQPAHPLAVFQPLGLGGPSLCGSRPLIGSALLLGLCFLDPTGRLRLPAVLLFFEPGAFQLGCHPRLGHALAPSLAQSLGQPLGRLGGEKDGLLLGALSLFESLATLRDPAAGGSKQSLLGSPCCAGDGCSPGRQALVSASRQELGPGLLAEALHPAQTTASGAHLGEHGVVEAGSSEVGPCEVHARERGAPKVHPPQVGPAEVHPVEAGTPEVGVEEHAAHQAGISKLGSG